MKRRGPTLASQIAAVDECVELVRRSYTIRRRLDMDRETRRLYERLKAARATLRAHARAARK